MFYQNYIHPLLLLPCHSPPSAPLNPSSYPSVYPTQDTKMSTKVSSRFAPYGSGSARSHQLPQAGVTHH